MFEKILHIEEPPMVFANNQEAKDPRDGLLLYGPYEKWSDGFKNHTVSAGVIGTQNALSDYKKFVSTLKKPIYSIKRQKTGKLVSNELQRPSYPGFEAVFNIEWLDIPEKFIEVDMTEINTVLAKNRNKRVRTDKMVNLYLDKILKYTLEEDSNVNIWFVAVPKVIFKTCRASFGSDFRKETKEFFAHKALGQFSMFSDEEMFGDDLSRLMDSSADFHNLLKAKSNQERIGAPIQVILEPKLRFRDIERNMPYSKDMCAHIAWSLTTTLYYKLGKKPWKISRLREGVCYLGLVFKKFPSQNKKNYACSAAQLFMDDGDGAVFRGNNGLWLSENNKEFHLDKKEAYNLLNLALTDYKSNNGKYPNELFIHGKAKFSNEEWEGFQNALNEHEASTELTGIVIKDNAPIKMFRDTIGDENNNFGVLRGSAAIIDKNEAFLFTRGFVPRLGTSMSMESPNPLHVKVSRGEAEIEVVLKDIMALTKLNYNACIYGDGKPVTLSFSDKIGSILTATDNSKEERRQFKYYI